MGTWARGRWNVDRFGVDLYDGLTNLVRAPFTAPIGSVVVRYEDLVSAPGTNVTRIFKRLGPEGAKDALAGLAEVKLRRRMGNAKRPERFDGVSLESLDTWSQIMCNPQFVSQTGGTTWIGLGRNDSP